MKNYKSVKFLSNFKCQGPLLTSFWRRFWLCNAKVIEILKKDLPLSCND